MLTPKIVINTKKSCTPVEANAQKMYLYLGGKKTLPETCFHPEESIVSANEFYVKCTY